MPESRRSRNAQKARTRNALLAEAVRLVASGQTPTVGDVAAAAGISRRTAYRYFPTQEQVLVEATLEALRPTIEKSFVAPPSGKDSARTEERVDRFVREIQRLTVANESLLRSMIRLTVSPSTPVKRARTLLPRGYRRIDWIRMALSPAAKLLGARRFERLVSALALCVGIEALLVLRDLRGLSTGEAENISRWVARTLLRASLAEADAARCRR